MTPTPPGAAKCEHDSYYNGYCYRCGNAMPVYARPTTERKAVDEGAILRSLYISQREIVADALAAVLPPELQNGAFRWDLLVNAAVRSTLEVIRPHLAPDKAAPDEAVIKAIIRSGIVGCKHPAETADDKVGRIYHHLTPYLSAPDKEVLDALRVLEQHHLWQLAHESSYPNCLLCNETRAILKRNGRGG